MARIILDNNLNANIKTDLKTNTLVSNGFVSDKELLKKRSKKYIDLIKGVDVKDFTGVRGWDKLMHEIKEEFGTADISDILLGYVGKCFLGHPFEVHILDFLLNNIIKHYAENENMPPEYEKARTLAINNAYAFVEVYKNKMILVREDGTSTLI